MNIKMVIYIVIVVLTFLGGYFVSNSQKDPFISKNDTIRIGATTFQLDSISKTITAKLDTFPKIKRIIKWKTEYRRKGASKYQLDSITKVIIAENDTIYPSRFYLNDQYIKITGMTYYSLHNQNTFDISYNIKSSKLLLKTYWNDGKIKNDLFRNDKKLKIETKTDYKEYYNYIESLKPSWYEKPYFVSGITAIIIGGLVFLIK